MCLRIATRVKLGEIVEVFTEGFTNGVIAAGIVAADRYISWGECWIFIGILFFIRMQTPSVCLFLLSTIEMTFYRCLRK